MQSIMLKSKLHRLAVTRSEPEYEGSLGIDADLMDAVKLLPYEKILVSNLANGNRFETYAVPEPRGSRAVCLLGPAARMASVGDRIVVFSFCCVDETHLGSHKPFILTLDAENRPVGGLKEV